jgi:hypothetical protein
MIELDNRECDALVALLVRVGRPHSPDDRAALEAWVVRLSRGRRVDIHGGDLLA